MLPSPARPTAATASRLSRVTNSARRLLSLPLLLCLLLSPKLRGANFPFEPEIGRSWENLGLIHRDHDHPVVQEVWLLGRYHGQYHWADGSAGESEGFEVRRYRYGAQARLFDHLSLHAQAVAGSNIDPLYNGFTELWAMWTFRPEISLTIGQQKHRFTHDRNVSSRYMNTLERTMLTNMFAIDYTPAVTLQGRIHGLTYYTGVFSNATGPDMLDAFTDLDSGWTFLAAGYFDLGSALGTETAHLHTTFIHSEPTAAATNFNYFKNGVSTALILTDHSTSLVTECTAGLGNDNGNAFALSIQPGYYFTDRLQLSLRYQIACSDGAEGLHPQRRYEKPAGLPPGDLYQAAYAGLNYYLAKHRLKLMAGIEYATMGGQDVWTASTALRFFFGPHSGGAFPMNQMLKGHFLEHD